MTYPTGLVREHPLVRAAHLARGHSFGAAIFPDSFLRPTSFLNQGPWPVCFAAAQISWLTAQRPASAPLLDIMDLARECWRLDGNLPAPNAASAVGSTATTAITVIQTRGVCHARSDELTNVAEQSLEDLDAVVQAPDARYPGLEHYAIDPDSADLEMHIKSALLQGFDVPWGTPTTAALQTLTPNAVAGVDCFSGDADGHMPRIVGWYVVNGVTYWVVQNWWLGWGGCAMFRAGATIPGAFIATTDDLRLAWSLDAIRIPRAA